MTIYKLGDEYLAARNNEFGYANYTIVPTPAQVGLEVMFNSAATAPGVSP